jgi:hypothetical protein
VPDGLIHISAGYIGVSHWLKSGRLTLFLMGSLIPDILLRGGRILFIGQPQQDFIELYLTPLHTPIASLFLCLAIAQLFHATNRKSALMLILGGCLAHYSLDLLQRTINGYGFTVELLDGYHWLYPISWYDFQFGLFWPEQEPYVILFLLPLAGWVFYKRLRGGK